MAQTKREIKALLAAAGIRPCKRFGQHFLIDGNLMGKLVSAAGITRNDVVLEVGPGTGALTDRLLDAAGHVVAVEIDKGMHQVCRKRFAHFDRITLIHGDILERKSRVCQAVLRALAARQRLLGGRVMLVANLPYQVATPLLMDLLWAEPTVSPMCVTVQAEVAERLTASPGGKTYGPISVFAQALATTTRIARVPPGAFWPEPKVNSVMLRFDRLSGPPLSPAAGRQLLSLVHGCFSHRRKTMKSNLRALLDESALGRVESDGRWDLSQRPERLTVGQWLELAEFLARDPVPVRPAAGSGKAPRTGTPP